jgi:hypothetical protein
MAVRPLPTTLTVLALTLAMLAVVGCQGSVDPGNLDSRLPSWKDLPVTWVESGPIVHDLGLPQDSSNSDTPATSADLTTKPGDPCTFGKCGEGMICMANVCHSTCSTGCGDKAPECAPSDGCHWVTSFSAACMPGTAQWPEKCGGGTYCIAGQLCVTITGKGTKCLKLCKYGCPAGTKCGQTTTNCQICVPMF